MKKVLTAVIILLLLALLCGCASGPEPEDHTGLLPDETEAEEWETEAPKKEKIPWGAGFSCDSAEPERVAYAFMSEVFPQTWENSFGCEIETEVLEWSLGTVKRDKSGIQLTMKLAVELTAPSEEDTKVLNEGPVLAGTGEYTGKKITYRYCSLLKQEDGSWQCVDFGDSW